MERLRKRNHPRAKPDDKLPDDQTCKPKLHKCEVCNKEYSRADTLSSHYRSKHGTTSIRCSLCSRVFSSNSKLRRHQLIHGKERLHQCALCPKSFNRVDELSYHERTVHSVKRREPDEAKEEEIIINSKCEYCVEKNSPRHHLVSVMHKGKPYTRHQCMICLEISGNCSLNWHHEHFSHNKSDTQKQRGYQCKKCFRLFASRKTLHQDGRQSCFSLDSSKPLFDPRPIDDEMEEWRNSFTRRESSTS